MGMLSVEGQSAHLQKQVEGMMSDLQDLLEDVNQVEDGMLRKNRKIGK